MTPSLKRGKLCFAGMLLCGASCLLGALDQVWTRHRADRFSADGVIEVVRQTSGKSAWTDFRLHIPYGMYSGLHAETDSRALANGVQAHVEWMLFNGEVLHYQIESGPRRGETFENMVPFSAISIPVCGVLLCWLGWESWRRNPKAYPPPEKSPKGGVDEDSLLRLNEH